LGDGFSTVGMSQRVGEAVSRGVLLRTVAVRLATLAESGGQRTATEIADLSQTGLELLAFLEKKPVGKWSSGASCLTTSDVFLRKKNPAAPYQTFLHSGVVRHGIHGIVRVDGVGVKLV
jgi:hypothetical protein